MATRYLIDVERAVVFTYFEGLLTVEELATHAVQLGRDPAFSPNFSELVDLLGITSSDIDSVGLMRVAKTDPFSPTARRALVGGEGLTYGIARMYQNVKNHPYIEVFHRVQEARQVGTGVTDRRCKGTCEHY